MSDARIERTAEPPGRERRAGGQAILEIEHVAKDLLARFGGGQGLLLDRRRKGIGLSRSEGTAGLGTFV